MLRATQAALPAWCTELTGAGSPPDVDGERKGRVVPDDDLLPLLSERLRGTYSPLLADTTAALVFTAGATASWTIEIVRGRALARRGAPARPTTTVHAQLRVLHSVVSGARSGTEAFLAGDLTVRGNLALALALDGLFPSDAADPTRTFTRATRAGGIQTFYLEAGPAERRRWYSCTASGRPMPRCCR